MEDIKTLIRGVIAEIYAGQDNDTVIDQLENVLSKLTIHPHPSDSDIEDEVYEKNKDDKWADTSEKKSYRQGYMSGVIEGKIAMRDRMNGEMCAFMEWTNDLRACEYYPAYDVDSDKLKKWVNRDNPLDEITTEQLLQKFRNR